MIYTINNLTLEVLKNESKNILDTLPLAHYLKVSTIPVSFSETEPTSYFNGQDFSIVVSLHNIAEAVVSRMANNNGQVNEVELEQTIRCFLYHETSHAILTPRDLMQQALSEHRCGSIITPDFANILEDERIETILKSYYLNVDFKKNLHLAVPFQQARDFKHFVFNAVRFRYCPIESNRVNNEVKNFIDYTRGINAVNNNYYGLISRMEDLLNFLKSLWDKLVAQSASKNQQKQQDSKDKQGQTDNENPTNSADTEGNEEEQDTDSQSEEGKSNQPSENDTENAEDNNSNSLADKDKELESNQNADKEDKKDSQSESAKESDASGNGQSDAGDNTNTDPQLDEPDDDDMHEDDLSSIDEDTIKNLIEKAITEVKMMANWQGGRKIKLSDFTYENDTFANLYKVIVKNVGIGVNESPVKYGYCGKFNPKKSIKDFHDVGKVFARKTYNDESSMGRKQEKKILNLFIDNSSSFSHNDFAVNKILCALQEIEHKTKGFEFRFIRWGTFATQLYGEERVSHSTMGTRIDDSLVQAIKDNNKSGKEYNIFLTDGDIGGGIERIV